MEPFGRLHVFLVKVAFPSRWDRVGGARPAVESIGLLGLALMALTLGLGNTGQSIGMVVLFIASLGTWPHLWSGLKKDWVARAVLIGFCLVLLRTIWAVWEMPALAADRWDSARSVSRMLAFPLACWWLGGSLRSIKSIGILVLAGAVINIVYYGNWTHVDLLSLSQRRWFGGDPRMEGLLDASILAGMIAFARNWWGASSNRLAFVTRVALWLVFFLLMLWALIAVQANAAWLAGIVAGLLLFGRFVRRAFQQDTECGAQLMRVTVLALVLGAGALLTAFGNTLGNRLLEAGETSALLFRGEVDKVEIPSIAGRAYMLDVGWNAWLRRPLFGWGPGIGRFLIYRSDVPQAYKGSSELHNNYLDVLMQFGVIGALLFFGFWLRLITRFAARVRAGRIPADAGGFVLAISLMFFIVNITDTYIAFQFGWFYMAFLCALLHSPLMRSATETEQAIAA